MLIKIYCLPLWLVCLMMLASAFIWILLARTIHRTWWQKINMILGSIVILFICFITFLQRPSEVRDVNLLPFHSFLEATEQTEYYRETLMNALLFFPLGLTLPFALESRVKRPTGVTILTAMAFSILIEANQYFFSRGFCETDDVIMNTLGAIIGSLAFLLSSRIPWKPRHGVKRN